MSPKNHYVKYFTKEDTYIRFAPSPPMLQSNLKESFLQEEQFYDGDQLLVIKEEDTKKQRRGVVNLSTIKDQKVHLWDPKIQQRVTQTPINNEFYNFKRKLFYKPKGNDKDLVQPSEKDVPARSLWSNKQTIDYQRTQ